MTGRTFEQALGRKVLLAGGGLLLGLAGAAVIGSAAGVTLPVGAPVAAGVGFGAVMFFLPDLEAWQEPATRRGEFRRAGGGVAVGRPDRHRVAARADPRHLVPGHPRRAQPVDRAGRPRPADRPSRSIKP